MPSDERLDRALRAVGGGVEAFRSAVATALDEIRSRLEAGAAPAGADRWAAELGPLARGRIDAERYAAVMADPEVLDPEAAGLLREAAVVLEQLENAGPSAFVVRVEPGGSLRDAVAGALARLGRAFGAARTAELARAGRFREELHGEFLDAFPPAMWNRAERKIAPPLVVRVRGAELRPGGLAEFLDGGQKLLLDVDGAAPPAALVRLVTPGVLVVQTEDAETVARVDAFDGPAAAAFFDAGSGAAAFVHDPAGGPGLAGRLAVDALPGPDELRPVGPITAAQQAEELGQLAALAGRAPTASAPSSAAEAEAEDEVQPADRLAAWLLRQASMDGLNGGG